MVQPRSVNSSLVLKRCIQQRRPRCKGAAQRAFGRFVHARGLQAVGAR